MKDRLVLGRCTYDLNDHFAYLLGRFFTLRMRFKRLRRNNGLSLLASNANIFADGRYRIQQFQRLIFAACLDKLCDYGRGIVTCFLGQLTKDMRNNLYFLPNFILVKTAGTHDSAEAPALCVGINEGEIVIFDKAYVDFKHLWRLSQRGVFWITRAKDNMKYDVVGQHSAPKLNILRDVVIKLTGQRTSVWYPETLRLIEAIVEIDGKPKRMTFITDNFTWAASSICDLYKARWAIEVFFKEIKQTLQLSDFIGYNENAVRWQIWTALLTYILLRFIAWQNEWKHTFTRLFTALRGVIWRCLDMGSVLRCCGTASDSVRMRGAPEQAYLPGFAQL